jgi:site-specific DNA-cytosine methylase
MSDTNTRSGLLWEVERILSECKELPQILLMENVPDVIGSKFIKDFQRWESRLRELGYSNHTEILNSKDFGIPQNRERAFMVSILGSSLYHFPQKQPLKLRLKDMLEPKVDEKYYISNKLFNYFTDDKNRNGFVRGDRFHPRDENSEYAFTITTNPSGRATDNFIDETKEFANYLTWKDSKGRLNTQDHRAYFEDRLSGTIPAMERGVPNVLLTPVNENCGMLSGGKWDKLNESSRRVYNENYVSPTITTMAGGNLEPKVLITEPKVDVIANINPNGTSQSGNVYDKEQLSPTLCASDYKSPPKITEPSLVMPEDTTLGYALAHEGDGVYTNRPEQKRGVVQKQMIQTIKANSNDLGVVVVGNYSPSNHNASSIVDSNGIAPTVMENHGTITATQHNLRIRKLTPRECYRLMGFGDQAFELAQPNQSNSSLYHQAGDSIVVNVLMGLFRGLL